MRLFRIFSEQVEPSNPEYYKRKPQLFPQTHAKLNLGCIARAVRGHVPPGKF